MLHDYKSILIFVVAGMLAVCNKYSTYVVPALGTCTKEHTFDIVTSKARCHLRIEPLITSWLAEATGQATVGANISML
jgi:hypothetical protein